MSGFGVAVGTGVEVAVRVGVSVIVGVALGTGGSVGAGGFGIQAANSVTQSMLTIERFIRIPLVFQVGVS